MANIPTEQQIQSMTLDELQTAAQRMIETHVFATPGSTEWTESVTCYQRIDTTMRAAGSMPYAHTRVG